MSLYSTREAFELYNYYLALKQHFGSESYDYFKYNGKVRTNPQAFETRKDKFFFYKLSKRKEAKDIILANMSSDSKMWIGDVVSEKGEDNYNEWLRRKQSLSYVFKTDLGQLNEDFNSNFVVVNGQHPFALKLYTRNSIHIETLIILDDLIRCFTYWDKKIVDNIVYPDINRKCRKYKPFMEFEKAKMKKILLDTFAETA